MAKDERFQRHGLVRPVSSLEVHAVARMRHALRERTSNARCTTPIRDLIEEINRQLTGWANYFRFGYPRVAFRQINTYARQRLTHSVRRRSQRPLRPPEGVSYYEFLAHMGLVYL